MPTPLHTVVNIFSRPLCCKQRSVNVHIGVEAAMSGVSRFLELPPPWRYSKKEGLNPVRASAISVVSFGDGSLAVS